MDETATLRVLAVGSRTLVVTLSGDVDAPWAVRLASEVDRRADRSVIVDLRDATHVDEKVQRLLVDAAERSPLTVVAEPWLLNVFELTRRSRALRLGRSLSEAVASGARDRR